jgi:predicted N-acyltransferase
MTHGWLRTVEQTYVGSVLPSYHMVWEDDTLTGAAICYIVQNDTRLFSIDNYLLGRFTSYANKLGISFLPVFLCGSLAFAGGHIMIDSYRKTNDREKIANRLLDTIETEAKRHNLPICFSHVTDDEDQLARNLRNRGYNHANIPPIYYLDIEWPSFDGYLNNLKRVNKKRRSTAIHEINRNRKENVRIDILNDADKFNDRLYELINSNYYKHNNLPIYFKRNYISKLHKNLGDDCLIYVAWKNNMITGCCTLLRKNGIGHVFLMGLDRELSKKDKTYFNLCYYHPIRDAIADGLTMLKFGMGLHNIKTRRGCTTGNQSIYYKTHRKLSRLAIKIGFPLISKWYDKKRADQESLN